MSTPSPAVLGLRYIASSLPERYDGYSEETIAIAKAALEQIAELEEELAKVAKERDEWRACAACLATASRIMGLTDDNFALKEFYRLQALHP